MGIVRFMCMCRVGALDWSAYLDRIWVRAMRDKNAFENITVAGIVFILIAGSIFLAWLTIDGVGIVRLLLM